MRVEGKILRPSAPRFIHFHLIKYCNFPDIEVKLTHNGSDMVQGEYKTNIILVNGGKL